MRRVLVAEDEQAIREFIVINLERSGYEVVQAEDGAQALKEYYAYNGEIDVALLDIMMPEIDGLEVCKRLREDSQNLGIIMLTAKAQEMDKVNGLMKGADDYMTKPFSPSELIARVDAVHRRVSLNMQNGEKVQDNVLLTSGLFSLDLRSRTLTKNGRLIDLTQVEFQIMEYFLSNPGAALSRTDILNQVWGNDYYGEDKIVDVNIRRLRMKIEKDPSNPRHLVTIWGIGYKWVA